MSSFRPEEYLAQKKQKALFNNWQAECQNISTVDVTMEPQQTLSNQQVLVEGLENTGKSHSSNGQREKALSEIKKRFHRIPGLDIVVPPTWRDRRERKLAIQRWGMHPLCQAHAGSYHCRRSRIAHARSLDQSNTFEYPLRHRCPFRNTCYLLPLKNCGVLLGACKVVFPPELHPSVIRRCVEVLELLAENFVLKRMEGTTTEIRPLSSHRMPSDIELLHPQVRLALDHIDREFCDPDLNVDSIARRFAVNRDYLSHLFSMQVGHRMSRHIFEKRIERARQLLETTDWQIKRIAIESGFLNTDWFSHLFHEREGITPTDFRHRHRHRRPSVFANH